MTSRSDTPAAETPVDSLTGAPGGAVAAAVAGTVTAVPVTDFPADAGTAATDSAPTSAKPTTLRGAWIPLAALCLAFFVEMVDNTVLTIALPTMGRDLHATGTQLQWVTGAYSLVFGSLLLTAGSIADRFGRRRVLLSGLTLFGAISALVWVVGDANQLIALRAALGVAAACMAPVTMSLVFRLFDDEQARMRAMTLMIVVGMSAMALGPLVAGGALTAISWHWLLFVNTPIAALAVVGVLLGVPADTADDLHDAPLDLPAAALTMAFMGLGCYALTSGVEHGWTSPITLACAAGSILAGFGFVLRERVAAHPMIDLALFADRTVRGSGLAQLGSAVAQMAAMYLLILHFQFANGWSPMRAGLANLPFVLTMMFASPLCEAVIARFGHRVTCLLASILLTASMLGLALAVEMPYWVLALAMVAMTLGLRVIMTVCAVALIEAVPEDRTSLGTALNDVFAELGTSFGVAVVGTVLAAIAGATLPEGTWSPEFTATFVHGEQVAFVVVAVIVGAVSIYGCTTLTDSRSTDEH